MRNSLVQPYQLARNSIYASDLSERYSSPLRQSDFRHLSFSPASDTYLPPMRASSTAHKFRGILDYKKMCPAIPEGTVKDDSPVNYRHYSVQRLINHYLGSQVQPNRDSILDQPQRAC